MSKELDDKLEKAKKMKEAEQAHAEMRLGLFSSRDIDLLHKKFSNLQETIIKLLQDKTINKERLTEINNNLVLMISRLEAGVHITNSHKFKKIIVENLKDIPTEVTVKNQLEIPKWLASNKSIESLQVALDKLNGLVEENRQGTAPEDFVPYRRVIKQGNRLIFDDSPSGGSGTGGGGGGNTTLSVSDIEIGAVELKNATTDDRASISAAGALKVDGSAVTQPVSGTFWQATQPVSGTVTATQSTATNLKVDASGVAVPVTDNSGSLTVDQTTASNLNVQAVGEIASGAADSGNPQKIGGVYNSTMPTFTTGQRGDMQITSRGAIKATLFANDSATTLSVQADNADGVANSATSNKLATISRTTMYNGTTWDLVRGDTTNGLDVDVTRVGGTVTTKETRSSTGTVTSVASSATNVTLLASNANRLGASIYNDSTQILYIKLAATASTSSYTVQLASNEYYEVPFSYTGIIDGIWASANGNARVTEMT